MLPLLVANLVEGVTERMRYSARAGEQGTREVENPLASAGQQPPVLLFLSRARDTSETEKLREVERKT